MELRSILNFIFLVLFAASCSNKNISDAYGQFEADIITISAEASGQLIYFDLQEGDFLAAGKQIGLIDTTQTHLQKQEVLASMKSIQTKIKQLDAQADVFREQLETARKEQSRFRILLEQNSATHQQLDQATGQVNVLVKQLTSIEVQKHAVYSELGVMQAKIDQLDFQIQKAKIENPFSGKVLNKLAEQNELM